MPHEGERDIRDIRDMVIEQGTLLHEVARRLIIIEEKVDNKPCEKNSAKLKVQDRIITGLLGFSGALILGLIANIDKIKKVLS